MRFIGIKARLLITTLVILIVSIGLVLGIISVTSYNSNMYTLNQALMEATTIASGKVSAQLQGMENVILQEANDGAIANDQPLEGILTELMTMAEGQEYYFMKRTDSVGIVYGTKEDVSSEKFFEHCKERQEGFVSDAIYSEEAGTRVIIIAAPIQKDGIFDGVIYGAMDILELSALVREISVGEEGTAYILDESGTTIAAYDDEIVLNEENVQELAKTDESLADLAVFEKDMAAGNTGIGEYKYDGSIEITTYTPIPETEGWSMAVTVQKDEFFDKVYEGLFIGVMAAIGIMAIALIILIKFATSIAKPIVAIEAGMSELGRGDFSKEFVAHSNIRELSSLIDTITYTKKNLTDIISDTSRLCSAMANENFDIEPAAEYIGDFTAIENSINRIIASLNNVLGRVNESAEQVSVGSGHVADASQGLSRGATEQASSIEELSATIAEISNQIKSNAKNAEEATEKASNVGKELMESNKKMSEMNDAMLDIKKSSDEIGKIIKTIEDIAFQTNILALNAAVEAARAGAAGKGFAVVADEVRNLASKSAEASKNTAGLIENSIKSVGRGSGIAEETATAMLAVVEGARDIIEKIGNISGASNTQAHAVEQITIGIDQIAGVVQTNSATAEESAAASQELSAQAEIMKGLVSKFKLKG